MYKYYLRNVIWFYWYYHFKVNYERFKVMIFYIAITHFKTIISIKTKFHKLLDNYLKDMQNDDIIKLIKLIINYF